MKEQYVLDMLVINGRNYHKFGDARFEKEFGNWMRELQRVKGFKTIEETCKYFDRWGDSLGKKAA